MKLYVSHKLIIRLFLSMVLVICNFWIGNAQETTTTDLLEGFQNPPDRAKPRTWFHVMSGNMTKDGLTKDLQALRDAGIGGIILFNVTHKIPEGNIKFNSPEHIEMIAHAAEECERLGLSFGVHNCDGWTSSGGPWVTPEHSMKQIVHRETLVEGGEIKLQLPEPTRRGNFYEEVAVIAYPALASEISDDQNKPVVTSSDPTLDIDAIVDGKIDRQSKLRVSEGETAWIQFDYGKPFTVRSFYLNSEKQRTNGRVVLQSSNDGVNFKDEHWFTVLRQGKKEYAIDDHFDGIKARYFRFETEISFDISEVNLSATYRFNNMLSRTNLHKVENHRLPKLDKAPVDMAISSEEIIDVTDKVDANGVLKTKLPKGDWTIMRVGYTITGAVNSPASNAGRGWEVDKMSRESFRTFYEGYVRNVIDASKKVAPNALQYIEIDSYEVGGQNWTKGYEKKFESHFGYSILDFLPLYAGRYVNDTETTDRILWDMRNFNSRLMTDNYFDYFTEMCHEDGLISYVEPYSFNAGFNELDAAKKVDIPMGEFWMHQRYQAGTAVSGARIYGKNIVSAESFSARENINWKGHPGSLKLTGDKAWTLGINEFMFHRFAHQANTKVKPGMTMSQFGSHIDRTQTWWDNAGKAWFKYLARGQYMLRQGIPVSRILAFVGDGSPNSIISRRALNLPNYINFDCVNTDALVNRVTVDDGQLVFPDGLRYYALHLSNVQEIKLSTLKRIAELANKGVLIIGDKPNRLGSYNITMADRQEFDELVEKVWKKPTTYVKVDWDDLFKKHNIPIDLFIENGEDINYIHRKTENEDIYFFYNPDSIQRIYQCTFNIKDKIPEFWNQMTGEITKLAAFENKNGKTKTAIQLPAEGSGFVVFRETSNSITTVSPENIQNNIKFSLTSANKIKTEFSENGTYPFQFADGETKRLVVNDLPAPIKLVDGWKITFPDINSEKKTFEFPTLIDWTSHPNEEVKFYSGTAFYEKDFNITREMLAKDHKLILDLGVVNVAARVRVNGKDLGVKWIHPYTLDITPVLLKGKNTLSIEVTNQWTNRLVGDENYPNTSGYSVEMEKMPEWYINNEPAKLGKRSTFTVYPFYNKGDELLPAGLIGPVTIKPSKIIKVQP